MRYFFLKEKVPKKNFHSFCRNPGISPGRNIYSLKSCGEERKNHV